MTSHPTIPNCRREDDASSVVMQKSVAGLGRDCLANNVVILARKRGDPGAMRQSSWVGESFSPEPDPRVAPWIPAERDDVMCRHRNMTLASLH